jgi:DNA processing protein
LGLSWVAASGCRAFLAHLPAVGPAVLWAGTPRTLMAQGLSRVLVERLTERRRSCPLSDLLAMVDRSGQMFVPFGAPEYPQPFSQLPAPPAGVFWSGSRRAWHVLMHLPRVTIVGTRRASTYGLAVAGSVARAFAAGGVVVLSGLALGIDAAAHRGAMDGDGPTVGVLGCGLDVVYPPRHGDLHRRVRCAGGLLGELPPGSPPARWTFPLRNRLLAALGDAVVVVEAGQRSGALITAGIAAELGRSVFAVPGPILGEQYRGCNALLYDGAAPVVDPGRLVEDFLRSTRMEREGRPPALPESSVGGRGAPQLGSVERLVSLALGPRSMSVDEVAAAIGAGLRETTAALATLELKGVAVRCGPGRYRCS